MKKIIILMVLALNLLAEKPSNFNLMFFQKEYHVIPEWFEVIRFNKQYVKDMVANIFKYNRTTPALNLTITFNVDLGNSMTLVGQAFKFQSNEYREFPLRLEVNFCQAIQQNFCGMEQFHKCGNFTSCPLLKARKYHFCNWTPDESRYPPFIPSGRYMGEVQGTYNSVEIFLYRAYIAITRPIE